eukprot:CAMPEP_0179124098 /NCGR_PEP_ID=MMETSP0796-20121207/58629_1 /TAXON_ID=73915 /ORGANISM="Pyrodinium bahamense, Strain pbaha01" /LENGTH=137 /DNA_ID=CAMNT_0020822747 /DNA_START=77 /DNA_END=490 /DNA_ORIENTATION=-
MARTLLVVSALLIAPACHAARLNSTSAAKVPCPSTTIYVSISEDAAGTPVFQGPYALPTPGECFPIGSGRAKLWKVCGPGKFTISRMSCNHHEYKAETKVHPGTEFTASDCKTYSTKGSVIDGYLGSVSFTCSDTER